MQFRDLGSFVMSNQYLWYPVLIVLLAAGVRLVIHRYFVGRLKRSENETSNRLFKLIEGVCTPLLAIASLYLISYEAPFSPQVLWWVRRGLSILALVAAALSVSRAMPLVFEILIARYKDLERYLQPLRTLTSTGIALIAVATGLEILQVSLGGLGLRLIRVAGIAVGSYVVLKIVGLAVLKMEALVDDDNPDLQSEAEKRAHTLGRILNSAASVVVIGVAATMVLSEFGMNVMPIITGAGIAGLAVGFGAQNLVRDIISGFFFILENQVRVGDVAIINETGGLVEAMNLRTIVLRDLAGVVHVFPNGEITKVSNMTKEWSRYVIDVGVAYKENVDHVMEVLQQIGDELCVDERFRALILDRLEILGVDDFGESQVTIKVMIKTLPLKQWVVGRELRRRIKNTFDQKGIEIPFPHLSVYFGEASKPFEVMFERQAKVQAAG